MWYWSLGGHATNVVMTACLHAPASSSPPLWRVYGRCVLISRSWGSHMHYAAELCLGCRYPSAWPCWFKMSSGVAAVQCCLKGRQSLEQGPGRSTWRLSGHTASRDSSGHTPNFVPYHARLLQEQPPPSRARSHSSCSYEPNLPPGK